MNRSQTLRLCAITPEDSRDLFHWRNEALTRKNSFKNKKMSWETHCRWFDTIYKSSQSRIWMARSLKGTKLGMIRFDALDLKRLRISLTVAPAARSQGIGGALLGEGMRKVRKVFCQKHVMAEVKKTNITSRRLFEHRGFRLEKKLRDRYVYMYALKNPRPMFGIKIWSRNSILFSKIRQLYRDGIIDYVEIYVVPGTFQPSKLSVLKDVPIIFHAPSEKHGFDLDCNNRAFQRAVTTLAQFGRFFNENRVIVHPPFESQKSKAKMSQMINKNIKFITAKGFRVIIENLPLYGLDGTYLMGATPYEIRKILKLSHGPLCLDVGHCIYAANAHGKKPMEYLRSFLRLSPSVIHLSDGRYSSLVDCHLSFGKGSFPLAKIVRLLKHQNSAIFISIETPKIDYTSLAEDKKNLRYLKRLWVN